MQITWSLAWWTLVWVLDIYAVFRAVTRHHGVETTLAWVFAILALPGVGSILYLLLASPSARRTTRKKRFSARALRQALNRPGHHPARLDAVDSSLLRLATGLTGLVPTAGNHVSLLADNDEAFAIMRESVTTAQTSIWAEYYLIRNDETGHRFFEVLTQKAREGVEVRLLYDAVGSMGLAADRVRALRAAGGKVEAFLPINPLRRRWSVHLRNHRKMIIVDGAVGFTGGMNVGDEYSGRSRKKGGQVFQDTHLRIAGQAVAELGQVFAEDWHFATDDHLSPPECPIKEEAGDSVVAMVPSGPDQETNANALLYFTGVGLARRRAWITSPYFIPDAPMLQAMISAAWRGVDTRILVPAQSDVMLATAAGRSYFPALLRAGVRIFEYLPSMLHAKTMVVDERFSLVGSANLDIRSFRLNFELGALILDPTFARDLENRFRQCQSQSREITPESLAHRPIPSRLVDSAARLLSPLL